MTALPAMQMFREVTVVPLTRQRRMVPVGGPIWPDFANQVAPRLCRDGVPSDDPPKPTARVRRMTEPAVWGGHLVRQFGHLVGEHLTRLPQSLRDRPDDRYLFTARTEDLFAGLPGYMWDVLNWYGLRRDQVRLVKRPLLVEELWVAAQGEMLGGVPTQAEFLVLLDQIAQRNRLVPEIRDVVFVSREGLVAQGKGGHAGESYLCGLLRQQGITVVEPGQMSIRRQMEVYAGARVLIFAEGSALHGRCLLGRVAQDIHVLRRRSMRSTARTQLRARCSRLTYHQVLAGKLGAETDTRPSRPDLEVALYDPEVLFAVFAAVGVDLRPLWDAEAYRAAVHADVVAWMAARPPSANQWAENRNMLADLGLDLDILPDRPAPQPADVPTLKGQTDGPVHLAEELEDPHREDLAEARGQEPAQVPDLPLEPR